MCELVNILPIDFQILPSHCVLQTDVGALRPGGRDSAGTGRIEETILTLGRMRGGIGLWSQVFLLQIVPLCESDVFLQKVIPYSLLVC